MVELDEKDLEQLASKGISKEKVKRQIETFKTGIPFARLHAPALVGRGILRFSSKEQEELVDYFERQADSLELLKFVPASGAATRMFKALFNFLEAYDPQRESIASYVVRSGDREIQRFAEQLDNFPFHGTLMERINGRSRTRDGELYLLIQEMLLPRGLDYGSCPKGLLPFHKYGRETATPFEEHLKEAALYASARGVARLHFTVSQQHEEMFREEESRSVPKISAESGIEFQIGYSNQKDSTDTLAVDLQDRPFRNGDGSLLFRPGGHGALIENLDEQDADIIFIKNIDNVVVDTNLEEVANSKKMLAGVLKKVQDRAFGYARLLEQGPVSPEQADEIRAFMEKNLNRAMPPDYGDLDLKEQQHWLWEGLHRPIRVCGMVKNEGEPGGGPFWVKDAQGNVSLQIVESAQIDQKDPKQRELFKASTHFNPVDLVCGVRDHNGKKYPLLDFVDPRQGFITRKSQEGKDLKALELPGLWNGAMAHWNTIFVEVPLITFNPVKTVNDLLKPTHQS